MAALLMASDHALSCLVLVMLLWFPSVFSRWINGVGHPTVVAGVATRHPDMLVHTDHLHSAFL